MFCRLVDDHDNGLIVRFWHTHIIPRDISPSDGDWYPGNIEVDGLAILKVMRLPTRTVVVAQNAIGHPIQGFFVCGVKVCTWNESETSDW